MNHLSIAIIRKKSETHKEKYDYLVIEENKSYKFFETVNIAIGGTFDFSSFKKQIINYFNLPQNIESDQGPIPVDFDVPPTLFKTHRRDPEATAYVYQLSQHQVEVINRQMESKQPGGVNIKWIFENELSSARPWKNTQIFLFERESQFNPPTFSNDFRASLKKIVAAKNNGKLVIFAGAGVSFDSQVPMWASLINELRNDLGTDEDDFTKVAEQYYQSRGEKEYHERIQEILKYGKTKFNPLHKKIMDLNPVHIITTNYDTHFEQLVEDNGLSYSVVRADKDLPYSKGSSLYVKMHGDFALRNIVLRKTDYDSYEKRFSLIRSFVRETFASKLVLFIGFSFSDRNLQHILKSVEEILQQDIQPPYLFNNLDSVEEINSSEQRLQEQGVRLLLFEPAIDDYFRQVAKSDDDNTLKQLGAKSQNVYKFLKVIEEFDLVSDSLENLDVKNQFVHSLERFDGLGAIPLDVLGSAAPFKLKQHPKNQIKVDAEFNYYDPFHFETLNEELLAFLHSRQNPHGEVDFLTYRNTSLSEIEQKINRYLKLIYSSGVRCIRRKSDTESMHLRLNPINKGDEQCQCARCLHDRFDLKKLIYSLNSASARSICRRDFHDEGLLEAYGFLKTGQVIKAFYALEEVRRQSLKSERYMNYFIASYNQTLLPPMLRMFYERKYNEEEAEQIIEKIESLDLHRILNDLPTAKDIKRCQQYIMENRVYKDMLGRMEDELEEIKKTHDSYKRSGYYSSGPNYWYRLQAYFYLTWNFYHQNLLFTDENYTFSKMAHLYLEGMIASHTTSPRYSQRLESFPPFFAQILVMHGYASDISKLFQEYDVKELKFEDNGISDLVVEFEQFLESGFERTTLLGERISRDNSYNSLIESSTYFRHRIRRTFNNFLLLLMHVRLEPSVANRLTGKIVDFLSVSEVFDASDSLKYFSTFVKHYIESMDNVNTQKIGLYILSDKIWSGNLITPFCDALINVRKIKHIFDEDFYLKLSRRIEEKRDWTVSVGQIVPLYNLLKPAQQERFLVLFTTHLSENPERKWELISHAYRWKMWSPEIDRGMFDDFSAHVFQQANNFPNYGISEDGHPIGRNFQPWNDLYMLVHMIYSHNLFDSPVVDQLCGVLPSKMFRWILKPNDFDYSLFEIRWLLVFPDSVFLQKLKNVSELLNATDKGLRVKYDQKVAELLYIGLKQA